MKEIGKKYNATAGQIALAWLLTQGEDVIPIPGTTRLAVSPILRLRKHRIIAKTAKLCRTSRKMWVPERLICPQRTLKLLERSRIRPTLPRVIVTLRLI